MRLVAAGLTLILASGAVEAKELEKCRKSVSSENIQSCAYVKYPLALQAVKPAREPNPPYSP